MQHLMIVPSLACPAACAYCFGPRQGAPAMDRQTVEATASWLAALGRTPPPEITFHGGEPLVPGAAFYRMALPFLRQELGPHPVRFAMQSNLWLLTDELAELLREYRVLVGTSLDGPEEISDAQRGPGYFRRTMVGIDRARRHGLEVGCICTFTERSAPRAGEILDFFVREGLDFTVHAALPSIRPPEVDGWALSPEAHGRLLIDLLDRYLGCVDRVRIGTFDSLCRSISARRGGTCTFADCLGDYLAVGPRGEITPCQRFAGLAEYRLGNVQDRPSMADLQVTAPWSRLEARQKRIGEECCDCAYLDVCRGGCPYNVLAGYGGFDRTLRDPHCVAYRSIFEHITERALAEVFAQENLEAVVNHPVPSKGLLRRGRLLALMHESPHPHHTAGHARVLLAAVALAAAGSPAEATNCFERLGLVARPQRTREAMESLWQRLQSPQRRLNNLYLHLTFACNLRCTHCYAQAGPWQAEEMAPGDVAGACQQAAGLGFRHAVLTGGEPLVHSQRDALLDVLAAIRQEVKPLLTVLRTNLAVSLDGDLLQLLACSTDQVVVSLDGDRATHDARRGAGTYDLTVSNLRRLVERRLETDLSLATVLPLAQANGPEGESVRALARELGIRRTRFRPLLPLGRAAGSPLDVLPETQWGHLNPRDMVDYGFSPVASCGLGHNLYVEPGGAAYPCYAWHGESWRLGSILGKGALSDLVAGAAFRDLATHTVDTNRRCRRCTLRYLCGGACRAWSRLPDEAQTDLDAPPLDCSMLHHRARSLLLGALAHLGISPERWLAAGLPLPDASPG